MTVADLIHILEDACLGEPEDSVEIRFAFAQFNPLECEFDPGPDVTIVEVQNDAYDRVPAWRGDQSARMEGMNATRIHLQDTGAQG
jgi:hypothetical protein